MAGNTKCESAGCGRPGRYELRPGTLACAACAAQIDGELRIEADRRGLEGKDSPVRAGLLADEDLLRRCLLFSPERRATVARLRVLQRQVNLTLERLSDSNWPNDEVSDFERRAFFNEGEEGQGGGRGAVQDARR